TLLRLAHQGLPICLVRAPQEPGRVKHASYSTTVAELLAQPNVSADWQQCRVQPPLLVGENLPDFWCTVDGDEHTLFFAHPASQAIRYPMRYGQANEAKAWQQPVQLNINNQTFDLTLSLSAGQSLLFRASSAGIEPIAVDFDPGPAR
ncbi:MAG: hypothetical protein NT121_12260, partial [Chloroflexi bacterium]|nr:hypothetical protein [Chloroflexota bacterium]